MARSPVKITYRDSINVTIFHRDGSRDSAIVTVEGDELRVKAVVNLWRAVNAALRRA